MIKSLFERLCRGSNRDLLILSVCKPKKPDPLARAKLLSASQSDRQLDQDLAQGFELKTLCSQ